MFKNIGLLILGSSVLLAGCKVDIYAHAPPGYTHFEGANGAIYANTNDHCSGLIKPDTNLGGKITLNEVFNDETTQILFN